MKRIIKCFILCILTVVMMSSIAFAGGGISFDIKPPVSSGENIPSQEDNTPSLSANRGYTATASSYYLYNNPSVEPYLAFDGDDKTGWDSYGEHEGAWIEIAYNNSLSVSGFTIVNGKPLRNGSDEYFYRNSRVKEIKVYVDGNPAGSFQLKDDHSLQRFNFNQTMNGKKIRFEIVSVYDGTYRSNPSYGVCITDISLI